MESPPSSSTWSEAFILSDDSGLLLTCGSASSGSVSGDSSGFPCRLPLEIQDSDCEGKSLSQDDSLDGMSDIMCGENFNTLKKGPHWTELPLKYSSPIEPPPEFQDKPIINKYIDLFADRLVVKIVSTALREYMDAELSRIKLMNLDAFHRPLHHFLAKAYWNSDFLSFSPCHGGRPSSRSSLGSSRLSSSHNSLSVPTAHRVDDSTFITQAVSHDTLTTNQISDLYNVPFDSDVYAVPVDVVRPQLQPRRMQPVRRKRRNTSSGCREWGSRYSCNRLLGGGGAGGNKKSGAVRCEQMRGCDGKRHSVAGASTPQGEPIHMTLHEVRQYLQTLYSSSSDSSEHKEKISVRNSQTNCTHNNNNTKFAEETLAAKHAHNANVASNRGKTKKNSFFINIKTKKIKDSCDTIGGHQINLPPPNNNNNNNSSSKGKENKNGTRFFSLKQTLCSMFRFRRLVSPEHGKDGKRDADGGKGGEGDAHSTLVHRALPPLPPKNPVVEAAEEQGSDFATSIHKVKDYGWYWGPLSSEAAEKILSNEPDGSFIVRDSSDDHYIFSLTFKLNQCVRHVRIEHDQGNFSFGSCTKFKSQTIVEFIENAVEHSRSGRYLFFLHRRPVIGPIRVQLLHPVSRFKQIQSLQHMCRFVILKAVRRDLIPNLPLPRRMIDYLNTPHYYSEQLVDVEDVEEKETTTTTTSRRDETPSRSALVQSETEGVRSNYILMQNGADSLRQS